MVDDRDMRWNEKSSLGDEVRSAMRRALTEALRVAAKTEDPVDGYMTSLGVEMELGKGMWDGGWKIQSSFVHDVRMHDKPFVSVHAYQGSQVSKGSVCADVVRTAEDRRYLAKRRLDSMMRLREELNASIDKLVKELGDGS